MSQQVLKLLPIRFDPQNFADHGRKLHGLVASKTMARLISNVTSIEPTVIAHLQFSRGLYGYPLVTGQASATIIIRCERCLDNMSLVLNPEIAVLVKPESDSLPENELSKVADESEFHEYDGESLVLSSLIEDELLLVMPLVPKHKDISLCNQDMIAWLAANEAAEASAERAKNPFAILKSID
jgi:uncharacterized protein